MGSWGGEDLWRLEEPGWVRQRLVDWSVLHLCVNKLGSETDCTTEGSSEGK